MFNLITKGGVEGDESSIVIAEGILRTVELIVPSLLRDGARSYKDSVPSIRFDRPRLVIF
jgi:hypothetical protein